MNALDLAKQLIAIKSFSGGEKPIFDFTYNWFMENGFEFVKQDDMFVAALKQKTGASKAIILSGHLDTVVAGDEALWSNSPFSATVCGDQLVGLGASDMKSAVAAQMLAAREFDGANFDLWVVAVANEELDGAGSEAFMKWFEETYEYDQAVCVIGEPTDLEHIEVGHRGNRFVRLNFSGESGHASQQASYRSSAMFKAGQFLQDLDKIVGQICGDFGDTLMGAPSIVPTMFAAGEAASPNKAAATAEMILDVRTTPQFDAEFDAFMDTLAKQYDFSYDYAANPVASSLCNKGSILVENMMAASGVENITISLGATDQISFQSRGIDTVVFGPGEFSQAHKVDEYILINKLDEYSSILGKFLRNFEF